MGFGNAVATAGPGGGYGAGHNSGGHSGGNTGGGSWGNNVATTGSGSGYGAGHNSSGPGGNTGGPGGGSDPGNAPAASRDDGRSNTRAGSRTTSGGLYGNIDTSPGASVTKGSVTAGTLADFSDYADMAERSFGGWQSEADTQGAKNYGLNSGETLTQAHEDAGFTANLDNEARGGLLSRGLGLLGGMIGGPVGALVGEGMSALNSGRVVAGEAARVNDQFGTSHSESVGHHAGRHARGAMAGTAASMVGGPAMANIGARAAGVPGAVAGAVTSGALAEAARGHAMGAESGGGTPGPSGTDGNNDQPRGLLAQGMTQRSPQPAPAPAAAASPNFEVGDFDSYASYAESFFTNFA